MRLGCVVWLSMLGSAAALASPRVAVHPLLVMGGDARALEQSRNDFTIEASRQPIEMVSSLQVNEVLAQQPGGTCLAHEGCLEKLCSETGASYALLATLVLDGPNFVLSARIVAADGTFVKTVEALSVEKDLLAPRAPQVQVALKKLFVQLDLSTLPALAEHRNDARPSADPHAATVTPEVKTQPAATVAAGPGLSRGRVAGVVVAATAVVLAGAGLAVGLWAKSEGDALAPHVHNGLLERDQVSAAAGVDQKIRIASGLLIGAGVAAAASVALFAGSGEANSKLTVTPLADGAWVGLAGHF